MFLLRGYQFKKLDSHFAGTSSSCPPHLLRGLNSWSFNTTIKDSGHIQLRCFSIPYGTENIQEQASYQVHQKMDNLQHIHKTLEPMHHINFIKKKNASNLLTNTWEAETLKPIASHSSLRRHDHHTVHTHHFEGESGVNKEDRTLTAVTAYLSRGASISPKHSKDCNHTCKQSHSA